ncbi:FAD-dependent oxidoreductase [Candidatus Pacearchaeota archaeon]|nr:FAD-dependent oxidoreductase [Candidatus Pacearchaeota archaeon]
MKKVVVVGGGFAGAKIAMKLEKYFEVTLIDTKNYFEFTPGVPRTLLKPMIRKKIEVSHKDYLKKARFIHGAVNNVDKEFVYLTNNEKLPYDYLAICSGSRYNQPFKQHNIFMADRAKDLMLAYKKIQRAKRIVIVGGGPVGVEIAAEISTFCRSREVTIIQEADRLMKRNNNKSRAYAERFLKNHGVRIFYNERVVGYKNNLAVTDKKKRFRADIILLCTGIQPNSEFLKKNFSKYLDEKEHIEVDKHLRFDNLTNVFAAGDVNNIKEEKTAQAAEKQAKVVIKNILRTEKGQKLMEYNPSRKPMVISLGKWNGIFEWKNFSIGGLIPAFMRWAIQIKTMMRYK